MHRPIESASSPPTFDPATYSLKRGLPGTRETMALLAELMALNVFAIDAMIPALPAIGEELGGGRGEPAAIGGGGLFLRVRRDPADLGPLAGRFGRKPVLAAGALLYTIFALMCGLAGSFTLLIANRVAMGVSAVVLTIVTERDQLMHLRASRPSCLGR